jgi:uncharacterized protein involved in high-affinity Fe2+ transport
MFESVASRPGRGKETGVGAWFKPFAVEHEFTYAGIGKKGGY